MNDGEETTEERILVAERDSARADADRLRIERDALKHALVRLVQRYVKGRGTHSQFIAVVNIEGSSSPEWDEAFTALGEPRGPRRKS